MTNVGCAGRQAHHRRIGVVGHRCRGRPGKVVVQHLSQRIVCSQAGIGHSLIEAENRMAIHFVMVPVAAVHFDDCRFTTIGVGIGAGAIECLGPVSGEALNLLGVEAVAGCMSDHLVGTRRLEDILHASMMPRL